MGRLTLLRATLAVLIIVAGTWVAGHCAAAGSPRPKPTPVATLPPGVPYAASTDPVKIAHVHPTPSTVHGGDMLTATVITTSNAAALTARVGSYVTSVPRIAPGTFSLTFRVPRLPLPSYHTELVLTAIRADGLTSQRAVPIEIVY